MSTPTVLVVDDEPQIRRCVMRTTLSSNGYTVLEARGGDEAVEVLRKERPDLILLDVNMPGRSGLETCREIRDQSDVAIIMLTVRNSEHDKVLALDAGADDYVVKPFGMEELLARIRAALRRTSSTESVPPYVSNDLEIDFERRKLLVQGRPVRLTPKEFDLLRHLVASQGKPLEHRRLLQAVWGPDYGDETEYLRVFINQLRKKIEPDPAHPKYIHTDPWVGYRFEPDAPAPSAANRRRSRSSQASESAFEKVLFVIPRYARDLLSSLKSANSRFLRLKPALRNDIVRVFSQPVQPIFL